MKVYVVIVDKHKGNSPEHKITCEVFLNKEEAINYQAKKRNETAGNRWFEDHNNVELFEKEI